MARTSRRPGLSTTAALLRLLGALALAEARPAFGSRTLAALAPPPARLQHVRRTTLQVHSGVECLYLTVYDPITRQCKCPPGTVFIPGRYCMVPPPPPLASPPKQMPTWHIALIAGLCGAALSVLVLLWWRRRKARRQLVQGEGGHQQVKAAGSQEPEAGLPEASPLDASLSSKRASSGEKSTSSSAYAGAGAGATSVHVHAGSMGAAAAGTWVGAGTITGSYTHAPAALAGAGAAELAPLPERSLQRLSAAAVGEGAYSPDLTHADSAVAVLAQQAAMAQDLSQMELLLMQEMQLLMQQQRQGLQQSADSEAGDQQQQQQQQQGGPHIWLDNPAAF